MVEERRVDVGDGVVIARRVWRGPGDTAPSPRGPRATPVVLLPGTGLTATDWDDVSGPLAAGRTVHAVDLRGHGGSDRPGRYSIALMAADVGALLDLVAGGEPVDLVGHSLGGLVACRVASQRPDLVRRLVLEDVGMPHRREPAMPERPAGDLAFDWRVVEQVRPEIDDPDPGWPTVVARVRAPTLVVGGGPASSVPQEHVRELVDALPDGRSATLPTGHLVHASAPEQFLDLVTAFLDG